MLRSEEIFAVHHGDCIEHMATMPEACIDFSVFSPPFPSLYAYTGSDRDIGNSEDLDTDGKLHLSFFYRQLLRVMKPGRVVMVHVAQIQRMKRSGGSGLFDFRGMNIRLGERAGFTFEYDWCVRKNPQAQAIRMRSRELQFAGLESDRAKSRGTLPDYLLKFRAPGENAVPVTDWEVNAYGHRQDGKADDDDDGGHRKRPARNSDGTFREVQVSRNDWIKWAEGTWDDIRETDTLNGIKGKEEAKGENDTKHICPLQLEVIERLVRLYTNPGELVFSPFSGIGSELYTAIKLGRRAYGCELKDEYHTAAVRNCKRAIQATKRASNQLLFEGAA